MPLPKLSRRGPKPLHKRPEPSIGDLISGGHKEQLSSAQKHGYGVQAALAARDAAAAAALYTERQRAAAEQRAQEDRAWAERQKRMPPVRPLGGGR